MVPCMIREDTVLDFVDDEWRTYCSETCHWTDKVAFRGEYNGRPTPAMGRLTGKREWETLYHGWDLEDVFKDLGYVRNDDNTLVPQPHVLFDQSKMWTLDHVRGIEFQSPRVLINEMSDDEREKWYEDYKQGFTIKESL
jgi:propane monooxygenase large subunit